MIDHTVKIIAYVDILGFSKYVCDNSIETCFEILSKFDSQLTDVYSQALLLSYRSIKEVDNDSNFEFFKDNYRYYLLSDSAVITLPYTPEDFRGNFLVFIDSISSLQQFMFSKNLPLRGGITVGELEHRSQGKFILGKGLVEAVRLENKAIYPRILIDPSLVEEFKNNEMFRTNVSFDGNDNCYFLNPIKRDRLIFQSITRNDFEGDDELKEALINKFDLREIKKYIGLNSNSDNEKIMIKVSWVQELYNKSYHYPAKDFE